MDTFDPMYQRGEGQSGSVWGEALGQFSYRVNDKLKKAVLAKLKEKEKLRFGEAILADFLKERQPNIYNIMGKSVDAFEALSEEKQADLAQFAAQMRANNQNMGFRGSSAVLTPEAKRVSKICNARLSASMGSLVDLSLIHI